MKVFGLTLDFRSFQQNADATHRSCVNLTELMDPTPNNPSSNEPQVVVQAAPQPKTLRNIAIGCATFLLLSGLLSGFLIYRYIVRPVQRIAASVEQLTDLSAFNERLQNTRDFVIPEDGVLSEEQFERFLEVQADLRARLGDELESLRERLEPYTEQENFTFRDATQLLGTARELPELLRKIKDEQVQALNEQGFSLEEYAWVRREILRAAGDTLQSLNLSELLGDSVELPESEGAVPEENRDLLEPYRERLDELLGFTLFGF